MNTRPDLHYDDDPLPPSLDEQPAITALAALPSTAVVARPGANGADPTLVRGTHRHALEWPPNAAGKAGAAFMSEWLKQLAGDWPDRHEPARGEFAFDAKGLRDWIDHLPLANPTATARQLLDALTAMDRLLIEPQQRLDALELLRGPVAHVVAALDRQIQIESFPLPPAKLQVARQSQDFETALAVGYCEVLHDLVAPTGKVPFLKGKSVALAATRALQHGSAVLAKAYLVYHTPPTGAWLRLHRVYVAAQALRIEDKAVADPLLGTDVEISPHDAYAQALLLALSNPYRYTQRELADVIGLTRTWAPFCTIAAGIGHDQAFAIETDQDGSLGYLPEERHAATYGVLSFDPTSAAARIQKDIDLLLPGVEQIEFRLCGAAPVRVGRGFVERLLRCWNGNAEREHARLGAGHQLDTVVGLHGLHMLLAGGEDFDSFMRRVRGQAISIGERDTTAAWINPINDQARALRQRARVLDQSLGGYRLIWDAGEAVRVKVGELIGLATPAPDDEPQDWMVGVLRWIRGDNEGRIDAGVELLARRAQPVGISAFDESGHPRPPMRALLLPDDSNAEDGQMLIVPHLFDRHAREIEMTRPADPMDWQSTPSVQRLGRVRMRETSVAYLRILAGGTSPSDSAETASATIAADASDPAT